jgi:branched-chain amino acid transport system permease protein
VPDVAPARRTETIVELVIEQALNGVQFGMMLFLMAAGLTLVFGIMDLINLAHGSLYMVGAYVAAFVVARTGAFGLGILAGLAAAAVTGVLLELGVMRRLYARGHLYQVLATFGFILLANETVSILFGRQPLFSPIPADLAGSVHLFGDLRYPVYKLVIIAVGIVVAALLYLLIQRTRIGMLVRAGATNREMVRALGVDVRTLYTAVFGFGALLAGLAGAMAGPILSVEVGMGDQIVILTFVVIVVGGVGSVRGALVGALLVGFIDTMARAFLPDLLRTVMAAGAADSLAAGISSISVYLLMAIVLLWRPRGLFPAHV